MFVGTFSILFASHTLALRRLVQGSSFTTAKRNMHDEISNNIGPVNGAYCMSGPHKNWKNDNKLMLGGELGSNSVLHTIETILSSVKTKIPDFTTNRNLYTEKVGVVMTYKDYVQSPHQDIVYHDENGHHSYIIHVPLCECGAWIYLWQSGSGRNLNRDMIHIPFGSILVLRDDVWHGGIVGGKGNIRFHAGILARDNIDVQERLIYGCGDEAKSSFGSLKVNYGESRCLLSPCTMEALPGMLDYLKKHSHFPKSYYKNLR